MKWNLVIDNGAHKGQIIPLNLSRFQIGREDDCQLRPASLYVSHHHCALIRQGNTMVLHDCTSTNGTFVNEQRVEGDVELRPGDHLGIGPLSFVISLEDPGVVNQQHKKSTLRQMPRIVNEEAVAALLLEMDKVKAVGKEPEASCRWRLGFSASAPEVDSATSPGNGSPDAAPEAKPPSPAEVAAAILRKKSFAWLRHKAKNSSTEGSIPS